jgi:hypothetical protein
MIDNPLKVIILIIQILGGVYYIVITVAKKLSGQINISG